MPFILGLLLALYKSSDTEYLSRSINIAGSERMRTMLLANYSQQLAKLKESDNQREIQRITNIIKEELADYERSYRGLIYGNELLGLKENPYSDIRQELFDMQLLLQDYIEAVNQSVEGIHEDSLSFIIYNAMNIKDAFNRVTDAYQQKNDKIIRLRRRINIVMLIFASTVTIKGLYLSSVIRKQEYQAQYDQLTGLQNRHTFYTYSKCHLAECCTLFFMDLNDFKAINDQFGHDVGDCVLIEVANRLKAIFSESILYRYGGDEFVAILYTKSNKNNEEQHKEEINKTVERIRTTFKEPIIDIYNHKHYVNLSMGVISRTAFIRDWTSLINLADKLMYMSKDKRGHTTICYSQEECDQLLKKLGQSNKGDVDRT